MTARVRVTGSRKWKVSRSSFDESHALCWTTLLTSVSPYLHRLDFPARPSSCNPIPPRFQQHAIPHSIFVVDSTAADASERADFRAGPSYGAALQRPQRRRQQSPGNSFGGRREASWSRRHCGFRILSIDCHLPPLEEAGLDAGHLVEHDGRR